jgi:Mrp family chromosome partitioning ATPase
MEQLLNAARESYDLVVLDTPPASIVSDAVSLIALVDGVLVVSRPRKVTRPAAVRLHNQLERVHAPVIGLVVNALRKTEGYGYGYEHYYSKENRDYLHSTEGDLDETAVNFEANGNGRLGEELLDESVIAEEMDQG